MSFKDIIKKSVLAGFQSDITTTRIVVTIAFAFIIGLYIYFIYKYNTKNNCYSKDFNAVLLGLPVVTAGIVLAMQSNLVISLGMVGALSIVRFRNAVKNSMDLLFLFWSISIGIIVGGGIFEIAIIISLVMTIALFIADRVPVSKKSLLLIINSNNVEIEKELNPVIQKYTKSSIIKSRNIYDGKIDIIYEIRIENDLEFLKQCSKIKDIKSINLMSHDGEERM